MSSARMLLAAVAAGLAACAHTPSEPDSTLFLPDIRRVAPVLVAESDDVPPGFDEHIVITLDGAVIAEAYAAGYSRVYASLYENSAMYRRPARPSSRPASSGSRPAATTTSSRPISSPARSGSGSSPGQASRDAWTAGDSRR